MERIEREILAETIIDYYTHPEHKFKNSTEKGEMTRKHVEITQKRYIGKESHQLHQEPLTKHTSEHYETREMKAKRIRQMSVKERRKHGISRQKQHYWKRISR